MQKEENNDGEIDELELEKDEIEYSMEEGVLKMDSWIIGWGKWTEEGDAETMEAQRD